MKSEIDPSQRPRLMVLGATGSVGRQLFDLLQGGHRGAFEVAGCFAQSRWELLLPWKEQLQAEVLGIVEPHPTPEDIRPWVKGWAEIQSYCANSAWEILVVACSGIEVLPLVIWAIQTGKTLWFANKEVWVSAGTLLRQLAQRSGATIRSLDSEHQALFHLMRAYGVQNLPCWPSCTHYGIARLQLYASGGPFWGYSLEKLRKVTPEMAVNHPVWRMGPKISVDSATWMNKGLEVLEACRLFGIEPKDLQVVRHPQGWVHGSIEDQEGRQSWLQYPPTMAYSLSAALWEARQLKGQAVASMEAPLAAPLPWRGLRNLEFELMEFASIPALKLAVQCYARGGDGAPCVFNAANEVAVERFLRGELAFLKVVDEVQAALEKGYAEPQSCEEVLELHRRVVDECRKGKLF